MSEIIEEYIYRIKVGATEISPATHGCKVRVNRWEYDFNYRVHVCILEGSHKGGSGYVNIDSLEVI